MGGRGSGGGWGGGGGFSGRIENERDLISDRETKQEMVDDVLTVMRDVESDYSHILEQVVVADLKGRGSKRVMAYSDPNTGKIGVNSLFWNADKIEKAYADSVRQGFHPSSGQFTGLQATIAHEIGHSMHDAVGDKLGLDGLQAANRILEEALGVKGANQIAAAAARISGYARTNPKEAVAEAFSDYYCNGSKAKTESQRIAEVLRRYLT